MESTAQGAVSGGGASSGGKRIEEREHVVVRFAGDSGDGMQLAGTHFTNETALSGNDLSTFPDYPAEIRAPAGTPAGVSGFQLHFASTDVFTPGDHPDVLIAMNPAALKVNAPDMLPNSIIIVDAATFTATNLKKAGYTSNPLEDNSLDAYRLFKLDISKLTMATLEDLKLPPKTMLRSRNFFALGVVSWLFQRPIEPTIAWIKNKFKKNPTIVEANVRVLKAGYNFGETTEMFGVAYKVKPAQIEPGRYRNITGNTATALGCVAAAARAKRPLFLGSYPITPASEILHELSGYKKWGVQTFQAEDEIAGIGAAVGAAFGGAVAVTTTSGPGLCLKSEMLNLALILELPLVIVNVQRGGPSTGLPTKTEQSDLLQAMYGRNGDSPVPIIAAKTPADCFWATVEAVRIAVKYMTPVLLLTDGYLGNGSEPWRIPKEDELPEIPVNFRTDPDGFYPYLREADTLSRPWVIPGTPGLEHRIGGLEKEHIFGTVSYIPINHEQMARIRDRKVAGITREIPKTEVYGVEEGPLLILGWGGTFGSLRAAATELVERGRPIAHAHLRYLNPMPPDLGDLLKRYKKVLVPELNMGQLRHLLRAEYLVDAVGFNKIQGQPFMVTELVARVEEMLEAR